MQKRANTLAAARAARKASQAKRKRLEKTGVTYAPIEQRGKKAVRPGRTTLKKQYTVQEPLAMDGKEAWDLDCDLGFLEDMKGKACKECVNPSPKMKFFSTEMHGTPGAIVGIGIVAVGTVPLKAHGRFTKCPYPS